MIKRAVESLIRLYDASPTLILYENLLELDYDKAEKQQLTKILQLGEKEKLNPIKVVLESQINVISEDISRRELTHSEDKVLINSDIRNMAVKEFLEFIKNDKDRLIELHRMWMNRLRKFLAELYQKDAKMNMEEVIFLVSRQFRISALSAIKAFSSN